VCSAILSPYRESFVPATTINAALTKNISHGMSLSFLPEPQRIPTDHQDLSRWPVVIYRCSWR
jgi:hypothetical protein